MVSKMAIMQLDRARRRVTYLLNTVAAGMLILMVLLTVADVSLRYFLDHPIQGTYELTELMQVVLVAFALGYCAIQKGHVSVEFLIEYLSPRVKAAVASIVNFLSVGLFAIATWASILQVKITWDGNLVSGILRLPIFLFVGVIVLGNAALCLVLFVDFLQSLRSVIKK